MPRGALDLSGPLAAFSALGDRIAQNRADADRKRLARHQFVGTALGAGAGALVGGLPGAAIGAGIGGELGAVTAGQPVNPSRIAQLGLQGAALGQQTQQAEAERSALQAIRAQQPSGISQVEDFGTGADPASGRFSPALSAGIASPTPLATAGRAVALSNALRPSPTIEQLDPAKETVSIDARGNITTLREPVPDTSGTPRFGSSRRGRAESILESFRRELARNPNVEITPETRATLGSSLAIAGETTTSVNPNTGQRESRSGFTFPSVEAALAGIPIPTGAASRPIAKTGVTGKAPPKRQPEKIVATRAARENARNALTVMSENLGTTGNPLAGEFGGIAASIGEFFGTDPAAINFSVAQTQFEIAMKKSLPTKMADSEREAALIRRMVPSRFAPKEVNAARIKWARAVLDAGERGETQFLKDNNIINQFEKEMSDAFALASQNDPTIGTRANPIEIGSEAEAEKFPTGTVVRLNSKLFKVP